MYLSDLAREPIINALKETCLGKNVCLDGYMDENGILYNDEVTFKCTAVDYHYENNYFSVIFFDEKNYKYILSGDDFDIWFNVSEN